MDLCDDEDNGLLDKFHLDAVSPAPHAAPQIEVTSSPGSGADTDVATCYLSSVNSCPIVRGNSCLVFYSQFPSANTLSAYICKGWYEVATWQLEGTNQLPKAAWLEVV